MELQSGLAYLAGGIKTLLGVYANGNFMDRNCGIRVEKVEYINNEILDDDLDRFSIEFAKAKRRAIPAGCLYMRAGLVQMIFDCSDFYSSTAGNKICHCDPLHVSSTCI